MSPVTQAVETGVQNDAHVHRVDPWTRGSKMSPVSTRRGNGRPKWRRCPSYRSVDTGVKNDIDLHGPVNTVRVASFSDSQRIIWSLICNITHITFFSTHAWCRTRRGQKRVGYFWFLRRRPQRFWCKIIKGAVPRKYPICLFCGNKSKTRWGQIANFNPSLRSTAHSEQTNWRQRENWNMWENFVTYT